MITAAILTLTISLGVIPPVPEVVLTSGCAMQCQTARNVCLRNRCGSSIWGCPGLDICEEQYQICLSQCEEFATCVVS